MNKTLIQSILLFMKGREAREKGEERQYLEFISAGIALAVVSIELVASSMEMVMARTAPSAAAQARGQHSGSITHRSAATYHSKLKVWAGVFNMAAGVMLVGYDYADMKKAFKKDEQILGFAYMGRGIAIALLSAGELMNSLVAGQLYFQYLVKHAKHQGVKLTAGLALNISSNLIAAQTGTVAAGLMLRGCVALMRFVPILGWATLAASVLFMAFGPDELEEWLENCSFSNEKSRQKRIKDTNEELVSLEAAVNKVMA